jgi:uncharacterized repeat protein (TIGR01451 family)
MTCSASYIATQADVDAGSVTNKATASGAGVTSNEDTATAYASQRRGLTLTKTASPTTYTKAGDVIGYTFVLTNSGNVTLTGPFTISDPIAAATCPASPSSLAPGESITCTGAHTATQGNVDIGFIFNIAVGQGHFGLRNVTSNFASATVTATPAPALTLDKTADTATYGLGQTITYTYTLTNSGNVTLYRPYTVSDDKVAVTCPNTPLSLAPGAFVTCSATHTATVTDMNNGSITNTATGHARRSLLGSTLNSNSDSVTVSAVQTTGLLVTKTPSQTTYDAAGVTITYTYTLKNTGNVSLTGPFSVTDDPLGTIACAGTTLAPNATTTCDTATYLTKQSDIDGNKTITNTAIGHGFFGTTAVDSAEVKVDVSTTSPAPAPALTLTKKAQEEDFAAAGDLIHYTYTLKNTGNVALNGFFTVDDNKVGVTCPLTPTTLNPGETITCTATYTVTDTDVTDLYVVNKATGHAAYNQEAVNSAEVTRSVPINTVAGESATPRRTAPATNTSDSGSDDGTVPLFGLLICLAFGSLALLTVQAQRRSIRR